MLYPNCSSPSSDLLRLHGEPAASAVNSQPHDWKVEASALLPSGPEINRGMQLLCLYKSDPSNKELRNAIAEHYRKLVTYNADRIWARLPAGIELCDLESAGFFGLLDAIDAFDPGRNVKFETYSVPRIRGAMLDFLRSEDWVPRSVRAKATKLADATRVLAKQLGRTPEDDELADSMGISCAHLERLKAEIRPPGVISLNKKFYETDSQKDVVEGDLLPDARACSPDFRECGLDTLRIILKGLSKTERLIVIEYYCLDRTMKQIGEDLGLSESRISQMHSLLMPRVMNNWTRHLDREGSRAADVGSNPWPGARLFGDAHFGRRTDRANPNHRRR